MMERLTAEVGRAAISRQGRDAGRAFIITQVLDDRYVLLSDGDTRKLDHPKKKKLMHLHLKPFIMANAADLMEKQRLLDADVRKALKQAGLTNDQPLSEED